MLATMIPVLAAMNQTVTEETRAGADEGWSAMADSDMWQVIMPETGGECPAHAFERKSILHSGLPGSGAAFGTSVEAATLWYSAC